MEKIECIIRQGKLRDVANKLLLTGIGEMIVTDIKGFGVQTARSKEYLFLPKTKIEVYVSDDQVDEVADTITQCCQEGKIGSGKIAIIPMQDCLRVRTGGAWPSSDIITA